MASPSPTTPAALIAGGAMSRFQYHTLALCLIVAFIDGFDALTIGYVVPTIAEDWDLSPGGLTPVVTAGALGLMFGAVTFGSIGDRRGRRIVVVYGLAAFGICTGAMAVAPNIESLTVLRFLAGLGLGAVSPAVIALAVEYVPTQRKSLTTGAVVMMIGAGGFFGGILASFLLPAFGWRSFFALGGIVPLLLVPVLAKYLPESIAFLASANRWAEVRRILARINPSYATAALSPPVAEKVEKTALRTLFTGDRKILTILLWTSSFCQLLMLFVLTGWMPTLLKGAGMSGTASIWATSLLTLGQMLGALCLGLVIDRRRQDFRLVAIGFPVGGLAILALVLALPSVALVLPLAFAIGFSALATGAGITSLAANLYPPSARSTGVAWSLTAGRVGAFLGPLGVGILIQIGFGPSTIFVLGIVPALLAATTVLVLVRKAQIEIRRQTGLDSSAAVDPVPEVTKPSRLSEPPAGSL
jgi:AAHS family 4-hydroxybenzoate transporter-like MFS transporter